MRNPVKTDLYSDIRQLIIATRELVAISVNAKLTMLYRKIVNTLCSLLRRSHINILLGQDDPPKREFYAELNKSNIRVATYLTELPREEIGMSDESALKCDYDWRISNRKC